MYMMEHPFLKTNFVVKKDTAFERSRNGFCIVRGKNPACKAPIGTIVGMAQEAPDSKKIISMTVYKVDGKKYLPDCVYLVDGREA